MSVYHKEKPEFFDRALKSVTTDQIIKPDEIVLILDGLLTNALYGVVDKYKKLFPHIMTIVPLEKNVGLSKALEIGALICKYDYIARMDSDDISLPTRFAMQTKFLSENPTIDVVGSFISEFEGDEEDIYSFRRLPTDPNVLAAFAKKRCPLNHVSVMMKKEMLLRAGNYEAFKGIEDYYLWAKMLLCGAKFANIPEYLVNVRAGRAMILRRGGWDYAMVEYYLQRKFYQIGFISFFEMVRNIMIRFPVRVAPKALRELIYKGLR